MRLKYHKEAEEAGIYIISSCGFESIPCDLGIIFTQQKFKGEVNSIEVYLKTWVATKVTGAILHYGTYESLVYGVANYHELRSLRSKLYPEKLPTFLPKLKTRFEIIYLVIARDMYIIYICIYILFISEISFIDHLYQRVGL